MRVENIKASCSIISEFLRRVKKELTSHQKLPVELFITINTAHRVIEKENTKIRRAIWRKKYYYPAKIKKIEPLSACIKTSKWKKENVKCKTQ